MIYACCIWLNPYKKIYFFYKRDVFLALFYKIFVFFFYNKFVTFLKNLTNILITQFFFSLEINGQHYSINVLGCSSRLSMLGLRPWSRGLFFSKRKKKLNKEIPKPQTYPHYKYAPFLRPWTHEQIMQQTLLKLRFNHLLFTCFVHSKHVSHIPPLLMTRCQF